MRWQRVVLWLAASLLAAFVLIQLVPYGRAHDDPPATDPVPFASAGDQRLFDRSCGDCHSNATEWPWYSNVAPVSWLVQKDVDEGRDVMNLSEWDRRPQPGLDEVDEAIADGGMPPAQYALLHGGANLSEPQKQRLIAGFGRLYAHDPPRATR